MLFEPADRLKMAGLVWIVVSQSSQAVQASIQNVAVHKAARQSSTYDHGGGIAQLSVDGNLNQYHSGQSYSYTLVEINPFWEVDLAEIYSISHIIVYNFLEPCCNFQLPDYQLLVTVFTSARPTHNLRIEVSDSGSKYTTVCYHSGQIPDIYTCQPQHMITGRLVKLSIDSDQEAAIQVSEVEVMANLQPKSEMASKLKYIPSVKGTGSVLKTSTEVSTAACTYRCHLRASCTSINVVNTTTDLECNLLSSGHFDDTNETDVSFWTAYV